MLLPLSGFKTRARITIRWAFVPIVIYSYAVDTIQHFRGINLRLTQLGSNLDMIAGMVFGLASFVLIIVTTVVAVSFFRRSLLVKRPLLIFGIRYSFLSVTIAFAAGLWMIVLNGRQYHRPARPWFSCSTVLPFLGWLLERLRAGTRRAQMLLHLGSAAWIADCRGHRTVFRFIGRYELTKHKIEYPSRGFCT